MRAQFYNDMGTERTWGRFGARPRVAFEKARPTTKLDRNQRAAATRRRREGLRPTFSALNALGQMSFTTQVAHDGFRAKQTRRPWKMRTWLSWSQSKRG